MCEGEGTQENICNMTLEECCDNHADQKVNSNTSNSENSSLKEELLDYIAKSDAIFKSQQKGDPELTFEEKRKIACSLLDKSHCLFLSKFGHYIKEDHLKFFNDSINEDYEVKCHINRLQRHLNHSKHQTDVKNRRYEALKKLVEKGEYFSECEMMKRNPLLYEHLVGQYLTDDEKQERDRASIKDATYINILMENIERDILRECQMNQEMEEDCMLEENDSDEEDDNEYIAQELTSENNGSRMECEKSGEYSCDNRSEVPLGSTKPIVSHKERQILKQEFVTHMYQNFLDGKDPDFDYSTVDENDAYDNVDIQAQDEEEKYFDSELPETIPAEQGSGNQSESEDELDAYMKTLKEQIPTNHLSEDNGT